MSESTLQFPGAYPKLGELITYRITIANRSVSDVLSCLEKFKIPGAIITEGVGTWFDDYGELLTEPNVTIETSAFVFDSVRAFTVDLLTLKSPFEKEAYVTIDGKNPGLLTNQNTWKNIN